MNMTINHVYMHIHFIHRDPVMVIRLGPEKYFDTHLKTPKLKFKPPMVSVLEGPYCLEQTISSSMLYKAP